MTGIGQAARLLKRTGKLTHPIADQDDLGRTARGAFEQGAGLGQCPIGPAWSRKGDEVARQEIDLGQDDLGIRRQG